MRHTRLASATFNEFSCVQESHLTPVKNLSSNHKKIYSSIQQCNHPLSTLTIQIHSSSWLQLHESRKLSTYGGTLVTSNPYNSSTLKYIKSLIKKSQMKFPWIWLKQISIETYNNFNIRKNNWLIDIQIVLVKTHINWRKHCSCSGSGSLRTSGGLSQHVHQTRVSDKRVSISPAEQQFSTNARCSVPCITFRLPAPTCNGAMFYVCLVSRLVQGHSNCWRVKILYTNTFTNLLYNSLQDFLILR